MKNKLNYFKHFLLLTLFSALLSLSLNKENYELQETISDYNISENYINTIELKAGETKSLNVSYALGKDSFLSIKTLKNKNFTIFSNDLDILNVNDTTEFKKKISTSTFHDNRTYFIDICTKENNSIEIINIVDEDKNKYFLIQNKSTTYTMDKNNFVYYIQSDELENEIIATIKFNDEVNTSIYYSLLTLSSNDSNYIPRVFYFQDYSKDVFDKKEKTINMIKSKLINYTDREFTSFIFSFKPEFNGNKYNVTITIGQKKAEEDEIMNNFLIGSIILALIFAVITFFLIRRKKNLNEKNIDDDFYKDNKEEDDKN